MCAAQFNPLILSNPTGTSSVSFFWQGFFSGIARSLELSLPGLGWGMIDSDEKLDVLGKGKFYH